MQLPLEAQLPHARYGLRFSLRRILRLLQESSTNLHIGLSVIAETEEHQDLRRRLHLYRFRFNTETMRSVGANLRKAYSRSGPWDTHIEG